MIQAFTETFSATPSQRMFSDILSSGGNGGASFTEYLNTLRTPARQQDGSLEKANTEDTGKSGASEKFGPAESEAMHAEKKSDPFADAEPRRIKEEKNGESKEGEKEAVALDEKGKKQEEPVKRDKGENKAVTHGMVRLKTDKDITEAAGKSKIEKKTEKLVEGFTEEKPDRAEKAHSEAHSKAHSEGLLKEGERLHTKSGIEAEVSTATTDVLKGKKQNSEKEVREEPGEKSKSSTFLKEAKSGKESKRGTEKLSVVDARTEKGKKEGDSIARRRDTISPDTDGTKGNREMEGRSASKEGQIKATGDSLKTGSGDKELQTEKVQVLRVDAVSSGDRSESAETGRVQTKSDGGFLKQLQERLNPEIVKRAGIIVRDGGRGEIRLDIKPEHLGNVRIRVSLEDSNIVGKIFVENSSIRDIFEQNLQNLQRSFREHGFETASLEVAVGDGKQHRRDGRKEHAASAADRGAIRTLEDHVPDALRGFEEEQLVDLVV